MSNTEDICVTLEVISSIEKHLGADRLEIAKVCGLTTVVPKGQYQAGQKVLLFPPNLLLPPEVSEKLGVQNYLRETDFDGTRCKCRVAATRLRGMPSYGFIIPVPEDLPLRKLNDFSDLYGAKKYEPPPRFFASPQEQEDVFFHRYTKIKHYWRFENAIKPGTPVRITEKIHGTNSRIGFVNGEWMAGSHNTRRKGSDECLYWWPLNAVLGLKDMITELAKDGDNVIVFGEIYGQGIQDMDYGVRRDYRVYDISINGEYLNWPLVYEACKSFGVRTVPILYEGPFNPDDMDMHVNGPTLINDPENIRCEFKGREGCVITPIQEVFYAPTDGRLILKHLSVDYLARKGAQDNA